MYFSICLRVIALIIGWLARKPTLKRSFVYLRIVDPLLIPFTAVARVENDIAAAIVQTRLVPTDFTRLAEHPVLRHKRSRLMPQRIYKHRLAYATARLWQMLIRERNIVCTHNRKVKREGSEKYRKLYWNTHTYWCMRLYFIMSIICFAIARQRSITCKQNTYISAEY